MSPRVLFVIARGLIASVFVGLGAERLLSAAGILNGRPPASTGGLILSVFELLAGVAIMTGWQAGRIALLMGVFLAVDAFMAHPFWRYGGADQHGQFLHFLKNFSATGGLLLLAWTEATRARESRP